MAKRPQNWGCGLTGKESQRKVQKVSQVRFKTNCREKKKSIDVMTKPPGRGLQGVHAVWVSAPGVHLCYLDTILGLVQGKCLSTFDSNGNTQFLSRELRKSLPKRFTSRTWLIKSMVTGNCNKCSGISQCVSVRHQL